MFIICICSSIHVYKHLYPSVVLWLVPFLKLIKYLRSFFRTFSMKNNWFVFSSGSNIFHIYIDFKFFISTLPIAHNTKMCTKYLRVFSLIRDSTFFAAKAFICSRVFMVFCYRFCCRFNSTSQKHRLKFNKLININYCK